MKLVQILSALLIQFISFLAFADPPCMQSEAVCQKQCPIGEVARDICMNRCETIRLQCVEKSKGLSCLEACTHKGTTSGAMDPATCKMMCPDEPASANNNASSSNAAEIQARQCIQQAQSSISTCESVQQSTSSACDSENSSLKKIATQTSLGVGKTTGASVQAACSDMGGISQGANAGLLAFKQKCNSSRNSCISACDSAKNLLMSCANSSADPQGVQSYLQNSNEFQSVSSAKSTCTAFDTKIEEANQATENLAKTTANSLDCSNATKGGMDPSNDVSQANDPNSAYCQAHPNVASCVMDCSKPSMANHPTCNYLKNPMSASNVEAKAGMTDLGSSSPQNSNAPSVNEPQLEKDDLTPNLPFFNGNNVSVEGVGGKTGGGANIGGGGGGSLANNSNGQIGSDNMQTATINNGYYGSSGGGSSSGSGNYASGTNTAYSISGKSISTNGIQSPDLRQFLPGGSADPRNRGMAGMKFSDGITGPNSDIWLKVQIRYKMLIPTFLP